MVKPGQMLDLMGRSRRLPWSKLGLEGLEGLELQIKREVVLEE